MSDICRTSREVGQESTSLLACQVYVRLGKKAWEGFLPHLDYLTQILQGYVKLVWQNLPLSGFRTEQTHLPAPVPLGVLTMLYCMFMCQC